MVGNAHLSNQKVIQIENVSLPNNNNNDKIIKEKQNNDHMSLLTQITYVGMSSNISDFLTIRILKYTIE